MKIRIFNIPIHGGQDLEDELNSFLSGRRIVSVEKRFVDAGLESAWTFCVTWTEMREKAPVRKNKVAMNEQDFNVFAALSQLRKKMTEKEGDPAYALFTNEQLAEITGTAIQSETHSRQHQRRWICEGGKAMDLRSSK